MSAIKITCSLCGETFKSQNPLTSCSICGVNLENSNELLLKKTDCISSEGAAGVHTKKGVLILSNKRVFWLKRSSTISSLGGLRLFDIIIDAIFPYPKKMSFSFPLDEITDIEIAKVGPFKQIKMTVSSGKAVALDIKANQRQEWIDAVNNAKMNFVVEKG